MPQLPPQQLHPCSLVTIRLGGASQSECGYCRGQRAHVVQKSAQESSAVAMGLWMESPSSSSSLASTSLPLANSSSSSLSSSPTVLLTTLYEQFLCRGWRRSGKYLYKPNNWSSCCPAITIRLDVNRFAPTKSQRRVAQKMNRLLMRRKKKKNTSHTANNNDNNNDEDNNCININNSNNVHPPSSSSSMDAVCKSGLLTLLQGWTRDILQKYWLDHNHHHTSSAEPSLPSWWNDIMPVTFKEQQKNTKNRSVPLPAAAAAVSHSQQEIAVTKRPQPSKSPPPPAPQLTTTLSTTVCAAMAGRSKGQVQREDLCKHVVQALQSKWNQYCTNHHHHIKLQPTTIRSIESHDKSGHVMIHIVHQHDDDNNNNDNSKSVDDQVMVHSNNDSDKNQVPKDLDAEKKTNNDDDDDDMFAAWWKTETSTRQGHWTWSQQQPPPLSSVNQQQQQPYQLQVTTLSAWDSALDPDVFRLYTLYQHQVHQDKDPLAYEYTTTTATNRNNSNDLGIQPCGGDDDDEEEGADEATEDGMEQDDGTGNNDQWNQQAQAMLETAFLRHCVENTRLQTRIRQAFDSFVHFLVDAPFPDNDPAPSVSTHRLDTTTITNNSSNSTSSQKDVVFPPGTYHQHYRIEGALIAVGVVDLLPQGLSSVYLFYHPSFSHQLVALGKFCSWKEIEFAQTECHVPYYYLGYYIESCPKMRYKAEYHPSELLCPVTYQWVDAPVAQEILRTQSPLYHCCQLYVDAQDISNNQSTTAAAVNLRNATSGATNPLQPQKQDPNLHEIVSAIPLEVGLDRTVTLDMLQEGAQAIVRPLLETLYNEAGPDIVRQSIVKLI